MKLSLRNRFLIPTLMLIFLGMGVSATVSYIKSKQSLQSSITGQIVQTAKSTRNVMASWVKDRKLDVQNWSRIKIYRTSLKNSFVGKAARKAANSQLAALKQDYSYYENIVLVDPSGNPVAAADQSVIGKVKVNDHKYFQESMTGNNYISKVMKSRGTDNPIFIMSTPVKDNGKITGVLFGVLDVSAFSKQFVDSIKVGETGYAFIFDKEGTVIAHPDKQNILTLNL